MNYKKLPYCTNKMFYKHNHFSWATKISLTNELTSNLPQRVITFSLWLLALQGSIFRVYRLTQLNLA